MYPDNSIIVGLIDGDGNLISYQSYNDFQYGSRSLDIIVPTRGRQCVTILQDDIGVIRYEDNRFVLKQILYSTPEVVTMQLLGKVAEVVLVRRCHEKPDLNKKLFEIARRRKAHLSTAAQFTAIGTGLKPTQQYHPKRYNPSDTQRDIIWVDNEDRPALMNGGNRQSAIEAGLQVKVSGLGTNYVVRDLIENRYEVPIIYFSIKDDYQQIIERVIDNSLFYDPEIDEYRFMRPSEDFIDIRSIDFEPYEELKDYYPMIYSVVSGNMELSELIEKAYRLGNPILQNTVMLTALRDSNATAIIQD
ncbi:MAG: hypothetical protein IK999_18035 [Ruminococcus sp.]|nr:hypothetical protein [Ruminococcus sp.]